MYMRSELSLDSSSYPVPNSPLPKLVICAGLPRSGSTWLYNAALKLLRLRGAATGIYSDTVPGNLATLMVRDACVVVKCHAPDDNLIALARMANAPVVLSVRDPRDCLVSFQSAFMADREGALFQLSRSGSALLKLDGYSPRLLVKYEDSNDQVQTIAAMASLLSVQADSAAIQAIAEELSPSAVRSSVESWEEDGTLDPERPHEVWTEESHWHANHCQDGQVGKYSRQLTAHEAAVVGNRLRAFFDGFGYVNDAPPAVGSGEKIQFSDEGMAYAVEGFANPESWGAWTVERAARIVVPLDKKARRIDVAIGLMRGPCFGPARQGSARMLIDGRTAFELFDDGDLPGETAILYAGDTSHDQVEITFEFEGLASPRTLGLAEDDRLLGVGIRNLRIRYE